MKAGHWLSALSVMREEKKKGTIALFWGTLAEANIFGLILPKPALAPQTCADA